MGERPGASTAPELVLETDTGIMVMMRPSRHYHVGRNPKSDVVLDDPRVSWHHAVLHAEGSHWTIEDQGSANGTYADGRRVHARDVGSGSVIRFGNPTDGPVAVLATQPELATEAQPPERPSAILAPSTTGAFRQPATVRPLPTRTVRIGREIDNDLVIDDLVVSRHHAELRAP
jgi:pSer/pThr/pTyr-binding forkhead associated (FHA) protein